MALGVERLCSVIESLLLISSEPVPVMRVIEVVQIEDPQTEEASIRAAVSELVDRYRDDERTVGRGIRIEEVGGALQFRTVPQNSQYVRRMLAARPQRLTKASLETLSVVAYRQPATKPEIEAVRGVDVGASLKTLLERDLIRILGKKDEVGRPIIYGTTKAFLELFGLRSLGELPTLREYHELDDEHQAEVDALEESKRQLVDLAAAADFLSERQNDPDLDALDQAVHHADRVRKETQGVLAEEQSDEEDSDPPAQAAGEAKESEAPEAVAQAAPDDASST